jgi:hypothetical protein
MNRFQVEGRGRIQAGWKVWVALVATSLWHSPLPGQGPSPEAGTPVAKPALWDNSANLRTGLGYKDNLLLSPSSPESSSFLTTEAEFLLLRLPLDGHEWMLLGFGEYTHYFAGEEVTHEEVVLGLARYRRHLPTGWKLGASLQ